MSLTVADPKAEAAAPASGSEPPRAVASGVAWTTLGQFGVQAINFAAQLGLTLFIAPAEFGLVGFGFAVVAIVDLLVDFGTGAAIVQRPQLGPRTVDTAFTINLLLAAAAAVLIAALGGVLALVGGDWAEDAQLLWWLAPSCLFTALATMPRAMLTRELRLSVIAKSMLLAAVVRALSSLSAAALGAGAYSLVIGSYASAIAMVTSMRAVERTPMRLCWSGPDKKELFTFGAHLTSFNLVNTALLNADAFVITALLGKEAFGLFALARRLLLQPVEMAGNIGRAVLFPALARAQNSTRRSRWLYVGSDQYLIAAMLPLLTGMALLVDLLAGSILDRKWHGVAPIAALMLPAAAATLLLQNPGPLLLAHGRSAAMLRWGVVRGLALVVAFVLAPWLQLQGVVIAMGVLLLLALPFLLRPGAALLSLSWTRLFGNLLAVLPATAALAAAVAGVRKVCDGALPPLALVALSAIVGGAVYVTAAWFTRVPALRRARWLLRRRSRAR